MGEIEALVSRRTGARDDSAAGCVMVRAVGGMPTIHCLGLHTWWSEKEKRRISEVHRFELRKLFECAAGCSGRGLEKSEIFLPMVALSRMVPL